MSMYKVNSEFYTANQHYIMIQWAAFVVAHCN